MDKNSVECVPPTTPQETHQWNKHTQAEISGVHAPRSLELQKASGVTQTPRVHHLFRATIMQPLTPWDPGLQKHTHLLNPGGQKSPPAFKDQKKSSNPLGWVVIFSTAMKVCLNLSNFLITRGKFIAVSSAMKCRHFELGWNHENEVKSEWTCVLIKKRVGGISWASKSFFGRADFEIHYPSGLVKKFQLLQAWVPMLFVPQVSRPDITVPVDWA